MVNSKIVTYDLCAPGRNYDRLYEYLKSFPIWAHITESTWFISSGKNCNVIANEMTSFLDDNDRVFVACLSGYAAWSNVLCESDYLKQNL